MNDCARCPLKKNDRICFNKNGQIPRECTTMMHLKQIEEAGNEYTNDEKIHEFAKQACIQEATCYKLLEDNSTMPLKPRLLEIVEFCQRMGYKKLGLAFCAGLIPESKALADFLEGYGFEVVSAICKVGTVDKCYLGLKQEEKIRPDKHETMCNPIAQAYILNKEKTDFNILMGLCVGHDSLFIKYSEAMCTVFAVKDRLLGHNPMAAIYNIDTYYKYLKNKKK